MLNIGILQNVGHVFIVRILTTTLVEVKKVQRIFCGAHRDFSL